MLDQLLKRFEDGLLTLSAWLMFAMMMFIVVIIFSRVLGYSLIGYIDVIELLLPAIALLGISALQRKKEHLGMDLLLDRIRSVPIRKAFNIAGLSIGLFAVIALCQSTYSHFLRAYSFGDSTIDAKLVTWPSKVVVPLALALLALRLTLQIIQEFRRRSGEDNADE